MKLKLIWSVSYVPNIAWSFSVFRDIVTWNFFELSADNGIYCKSVPHLAGQIQSVAILAAFHSHFLA